MIRDQEDGRARKEKMSDNVDAFLRSALSRNWRTFLVGPVLALFAAIAMPSPTMAYPDHPVRMIVPEPPGGIVDIVARLLQPHLAAALGQPVVIEDRPGASDIIGANAVATAKPDGYTLLIVPTTFTINPAIHAKLPFDPIRSFAPIAIIARNSLLFLVNPRLKATTLKEFVALAKARPGKINYATPGASSQAHLLLELWSSQAGIRMQHVPYIGGMPALLATMKGEADMTLLSTALSLPQIKAGKVRALATGGATREAQLPDVPTAAEAGYPTFKATQWIGLLTTGATPKPIVDQLNHEVQRALQVSDMRTGLAKLGMTEGGGPASDFGALIKAEIAQWTDAAQKAHIKME
jgi:tripartite-type tricarboxylate transporter receptor subunit TctC